jgi:feruloyl esterase
MTRKGGKTMRSGITIHKRLALFLMIAVLTFGLCAIAPGEANTQDRCVNLKNLAILDTVILSVNVVNAANDLPEYCRVTGYVLPAIYFEVKLPTSQWNKKFYMAGCGGYCGRVMDRKGFTNAMNYGLKRNYSVATTDMGHWGKSMFDGTWAYNARQKEIDFGYRGTHEVCRVAKEITKAYYGESPAHSYFAGCSNGGRQGMVEAQRYPKDFDGIISGAPALNWMGLVGTHGSWIIQANRGPNGKPIIDHEQLAVISKAVYEKCDGADGVVDGIIVDPQKCSFEAESLLCEGAETENCLTPEQVVTLKKFYGGAKDSSGKQLYPGGLPVGSETFWGLWIIGGKPGPYGGILPALMTMLTNAHLKYTAFEADCSNCSPYSFDFDVDPAKTEYMASILNATSPDLTKFKEAGGKLIMYQGWADPAVTPFMTVAYYQSVVDKMGGLEKSEDFIRLYMIPGMAHCQIPPGVGPDRFDLLAPLEDWVEKGVAPTRVIASQIAKDGKVVRTRPLCVFPKVSKYKGSGSTDDAANFICEDQ